MSEKHQAIINDVGIAANGRNWLCYADSQLSIAETGLPLATLAAQWGTPLYITHLDSITARAKALRAAFPCPVSIHYAVKANPRLALLQALSPHCGADVVSIGEAQAAMKAGIAANDIVYSGVGKTNADLDAAIALGIGQINAESVEEVAAIRARAQALETPARVGLRVNPDIAADTIEQIRTGGAEDKFGIAIDAIPELYRSMHSEDNAKWLRPAGLAVHIGSQMRNLAPLSRAIRAITELAIALRQQGCDVPTLDLGGGLGVQYDHAPEPNAQAYVAALMEGLGDHAADFHLAIEPGRWLVAHSSIIVSTVARMKAAPKPDLPPLAILDSGMHTLMRPALYNAVHHVVPLALHPTELAYRIAGPVCESTDTWQGTHDLPATLTAGDEVAILDVGAYGATMANAYNLFGMPAEIGISNGNVFPMRHAIPASEWYALDLPLELNS